MNIVHQASYTGVFPEDRRGQSFTVGRAGLLAGIEISPSLFYGAAPTDQLELELFRCESIVECNAASLGSVTLAAGALTTQLPVSLVPDFPGVGYFDVSPLGLSVEAGDIYRFDVIAHISAPCSSDFPCAYAFTLGFNDFYEDEPRFGYLPGIIFHAGYVDPVPSADLHFVTYVVP